MSTTNLLVISDLHLADNRNALEGFHLRQQMALEGLLQAALPGGSLEIPSELTLIINGDCFDFLAVEPYPPDGLSTPQISLEKLEQIAAAHEPFFSALRTFLDQGGRVIFLIGNHDIELCFAAVRARVAQLIDPTHTRRASLHFCLDQHFQPLPDVWIEHGNQYDLWNATSELWDEHGKALNPEPEQIQLPWGTQYMQRVSLPISLDYPYFERFDPALGMTRQIALLSLLNPALVVETARKVAGMMTNGHQPLRDLPPGDEHVPARLFAHAMSDFAAFLQDIQARVDTWSAMESRLYSPIELMQRQAETLSTFFTLSMALEEGQDQALQAILAPPSDAGDEDTARGMQNVLRTHPDLRVAIAGHTHITRREQSLTHEQLYLNTATWTQRLQPPTFDTLTNVTLDWLRASDLACSPLVDKTSHVFAWISAQPGQPSTARLCTWEGGRNGAYRVL